MVLRGIAPPKAVLQASRGVFIALSISDNFLRGCDARIDIDTTALFGLPAWMGHCSGPWES